MSRAGEVSELDLDQAAHSNRSEALPRFGDALQSMWEASMIDLRAKSELFDDGTYVVVVNGELDLYSAPQLESELAELHQKNLRSVVVDLTGCEFIDSTALALLVQASKRLGAAQATFSIVTPDRNIRKIFEITGLDRVLTIHQTRAVAMNGGLRIA